MNIFFADTFYFIALINPADKWHHRVVEYTKTLEGRMVTTAWILAEVGDALAHPNNRQLFLDLVKDLRANPNVVVVPPDAAQFEKGMFLYEKRPDKNWSLTDCISFQVMKEMGISKALTADRHFSQAGFSIIFANA